MLGGHMGGLSGIATRSGTARMNGYRLPLVFVEDFDHPFCGANAHFLMDQGMGNGIEVFLKIDVVVDIHSGCLPGGQFIRSFRQWSAGRAGPVLRTVRSVTFPGVPFCDG